MTTTLNSLISNLDELTCAIEQDFENFSGIIDQVIGYVVKNPQHTRTFISYLNGQLSISPTRGKGLILLSAFIPLCPTDVAMEHATAWINNSLKYCENEKDVNQISYKIIAPLLELCNKTPELNKIAVSNILEKIIDQIKSIDVESHNAVVALECLLTCVKVYPGACGPRKIPLDRYLITYLDSFLPAPTVRKAGKCYHSLQQVGGGGIEGINYINNWNKTQQRLVATLHSLMDQFFETVMEFGDYEQDIGDITPLELPPVLEGKHFKKIAFRMINTIIFLEEMLLGAFPVKKSIIPGIILNVISRGLAVTASTLGARIVEDSINLSSYLCLIHKNLLQLLQCLIASLGSNLIPWGHQICKLIMNTMKNISPDDAFCIHTICKLRLTTYESLKLWLNSLKAASSVHMIMDALLPIIVNDISSIKNELNLTVQQGGSKHLNKKARKKLIQQKTDIFAAKRLLLSNSKFLNREFNFQADICASALKTVQAIINYEGSLIKPVHHKQLQEFIIKTLFSIQNGYISYPYNNEDCQIELYQTLIRLTANHHYNIPPPTQYAFALLSKGQSNINPRISDICSIGISNLNTFIHPAFASMSLPLDMNELNVELNIKEKDKKIDLAMDIDHSDQEEKETINKNQEKETVKEVGRDDSAKLIQEANSSESLKGTDTAEEEEIETIGTKKHSNNEDITEISDSNASDKDNMEKATNNNIVIIENDNNSNLDTIALDMLSEEIKSDLQNVETIDNEEETIEDIKETEASNENKINEVINLDEEDICSSFVDIINE